MRNKTFSREVLDECLHILSFKGQLEGYSLIGYSENYINYLLKTALNDLGGLGGAW